MAKDDDHIENDKMPLLEHLVELRTRLLWSAVAIIVLFIGCFYIADDIYAFLVQPLADVFAETGRDRRLIFTALQEAFFTYIKVSFFAAMFIGFPFIASQIWMFVAPGLYKRKYAIVCAFIAAAILTPPDPISQIGLALPIILLYEVSIILARFSEKKRNKRRAEEDAAVFGDTDDDDDDTPKDGGAKKPGHNDDVGP